MLKFYMFVGKYKLTERLPMISFFVLLKLGVNIKRREINVK